MKFLIWVIYILFIRRLIYLGKRRTIGKSLPVACAIISLFLNNCFELSSLQSAKLLAKNKLNIMPEYSSVMYTHTGKLKQISNSFGFQCGYGLMNSFNIFIKYARLEIPEYTVGYNYLCVEPKFRLIKNSIAFSMPLCCYFGENIDFIESGNVQPTFYYTCSINNWIDITIAPKAVIFFPSFNNILVVNINTGIHLFSDKLQLMPEIGYGFKLNSKDQFLIGNIGIGFTYYFTK